MKLYVIQSCAMSVDGYIADRSDKRLILSNQKDLERVDTLRASCDAILIGAETLRRDNPHLVVKQNPSHKLVKIVITRSGNLDPTSNFFTSGSGEKLVYAPDEMTPRIQQHIQTAGQVINGGAGRVDLRKVLSDLEERGVKRLLVEGGSSLGSQFLEEGLVDELQLAIAPFFVGDELAPRFVRSGNFLHTCTKRMHLKSTMQIDDMAVLIYTLETMR